MTTIIPSKERLAQRLHAMGLLEFENRARAGEFSDFESKHATPKILLVQILQELAKTAGNPALAKMVRDLSVEVMDGKYDDTKEEAESYRERYGGDLF